MKKIDSLNKILLSSKPSILIKENEQYIFELIPELKKCKGFNQNNEWHIYDVYDHTLSVIDLVQNNLTLRLAALFHDLGKPDTYQEDSAGVGHFYGHYKKSCEILDRYDIYDKELVKKLVFYHDINIDELTEQELDNLIFDLGLENIDLLFDLKRSDLLSQNPKYNYMLETYNKQLERIKEKYRFKLYMKK